MRSSAEKAYGGESGFDKSPAPKKVESKKDSFESAENLTNEEKKKLLTEREAELESRYLRAHDARDQNNEARKKWLGLQKEMQDIGKQIDQIEAEERKKARRGSAT